jgi:hypothetical protein
VTEKRTDEQLSRSGDEEPPPSGKEMPHTPPTSVTSTSDEPPPSANEMPHTAASLSSTSDEPPPSGKEMPHTTPPAEES